MTPAYLEQTLRNVLHELRLYRPDLILIGGWVPYLYRHYGGFGPLSERGYAHIRVGRTRAPAFAL